MPSLSPTRSSGSASGRRERRKAETRRRLVEAARSLFVEHGYNATRPQDIAREADVAVGTFYLHFADKSEAFQAFTHEAAEEMLARVHARQDDDALDFAARSRRALEALTDYTAESPGVVRAAFAEETLTGTGVPRESSLRGLLVAELAGEIQQGIDRGELRDDLDLPLISHGISGFLVQALSYGQLTGVERAAAIDSITDFLTRALSPAEHPKQEL